MHHFSFKRKPLPTRVIGLMFVVVSLFPLIEHAPALLDEWRTTSWPTADGIMDSAKATERRGRKRRVHHELKLRYSYTVGAATFAGDHYFLGTNRTGDANEAASFAGAHQNGARVPVYYDPANTSRSCLRAGISPTRWLPVSIGGAIALLGLVLLFLGGALDRSRPRP